MFINHILFFITLFILPTYVFLHTKKIKESTDPFIKEKTYYKIFVIYWALTISLFLFSDLHQVFYTQEPFKLHLIWTLIGCLSGIYLLIGQVLPIILLAFSDKLRTLTAASFDNKSYIYPTTDRQRKLFIIVPITVGICEEIIFRGYLFQYFQTSPYALSSTMSLLLVTVIFGLGHFQQGLSGVIETLILGYLLGFLYLVTGNLLLPIILHILFDLKILIIPHLLNKNKIQNITDNIN